MGGAGGGGPVAVALLALVGWEIARRPRPAEPRTIAASSSPSPSSRCSPRWCASRPSPPASLISSDSAVAGIIAQELAAGQRPAPIYAPGFP